MKFTAKEVVGIVLFIWGLATAWFAMDKRLTLLEREQRYSHGDLKPFLKE